MHDATGDTAARVATVHDLLATDLRMPRVRSLERACSDLAARPLAEVITELADALTGPLGTDDRRRLHVLVSTLYHHAGAPLRLTTELRAAIEATDTHHHTEE